MRKTTKKLIGGTMIIALLATIGAALVTADPDQDTHMPCADFPFARPSGHQPPFFSELTKEQREEIKTLVQTLIENDATQEEIHEAVTKKLETYGIETPTRDEMLEQKIEHTENRLEILKRTQELRAEGYDWDEINDIIQEEFDLPDCPDQLMKPGFQPGRNHHRPRWN